MPPCFSSSPNLISMKTPHPTVLRLASSCVLAALLSATATLHAATYTWLPTGITGSWDTTTANWNDGVTNPTTWVNGSGNTAAFNAFAASTTITFDANMTAGTLSTNGGSTITFNGGKTLDVTTINTAGGGNIGAIDMFNVLTGNHDLNYFGGAGSGGAGRLNLKVANTYTGDTNLSGQAYLTLHSTLNVAYLPTTTTLNMGSTATTFRFGANNQSQEIAGLTSSGTGSNSAQIITPSLTGNTLTIKTKSAVTTTFTGTVGGTLNLVVNGSGTQVLGGTTDNTFTGTTTVSGGTLSLAKLNALKTTSSITVSGGILDSSIANVALGVGAVSMSSGEISAQGNAAAGTFTVAANQTFSTTGGKLTFNIGTSRDQIIGSGTGTFSIGSGTELALILGSGFSYANTYNILGGFSSGSVAGTGVTFTGYDTTNYVAVLSNTGVLSFSAASIPEPSTYAALAGVAILGFASLRRRRTAQR